LSVEFGQGYRPTGKKTRVEGRQSLNGTRKTISGVGAQTSVDVGSCRLRDFAPDRYSFTCLATLNLLYSRSGYDV